MSATVRSLIKTRADGVHALAPESMVNDAVALMNRRNIGAVVVMNPEAELLGVFTERDVLRRVLGEGLDAGRTPLEAVMTREVFWIPPDCSVDEAMAVVTERNIRHLPVMEAGRVLGMISVRDLTAAVVAHREFELNELRSYVHGSYGSHVGS
jgi:CBS domain-containing protein